jgi:hypothetical protein
MTLMSLPLGVYKLDPSPKGVLPRLSIFFNKPLPQSSASSQILFTKKPEGGRSKEDQCLRWLGLVA